VTPVGRLLVRIQPGARRTGWAGWFGDLPKLAVAAPPVDGAANEAVIEALAATFGVPARRVHLVGGAASRTKRFEIDGLDETALGERLISMNPRLSR
jgi:uncharacterized protein YggU (UPF0235/DUF167 family)